MALYDKDFIDARRQEFMDYAATFEYEIAAEGTWYKCTEQSRSIDGNTITYNLILPNYSQSAHKITGLRFVDESGSTIAQRSMSIEVNSAQTVLCEISIDYEEV